MLPYCSRCRQESTGKFCPECGTPLVDAPPAPSVVAQTRGDTGVDRSVQQTDVVAPPVAAAAELAEACRRAVGALAEERARLEQESDRKQARLADLQAALEAAGVREKQLTAERSALAGRLERVSAELATWQSRAEAAESRLAALAAAEVRARREAEPKARRHPRW